jgi:diguanylate cyclase (GGDEF)-like protein
MEQDAALQLLRSSRQMAETQSLAPLLDLIFTVTLSWSGATDGYLIWLDDDSVDAPLHCFRARGRSGPDPSEFPLAAIRSFCLIQPVPAILTPSDDKFGILGFKAARSVLWAPFSRAGRIRGGLVLANPQMVDNESQLALLGLLVEHAGLALQNVLLIERMGQEIQYLSDFDHLTTKLPNRNLFKRRVEDARHRANADQTLALLFLDLDDFGRVNRTMGHSTGDKFLCEAANRVKRVLLPYGSNALAGRLGGDEFGVLLGPPFTHERVLEAARTLVNNFREPLTVASYHQRITITIGVALAPVKEAQKAEELLVQAEKAMYAAKSRGGNSFEVSNLTDAS